MWSTEQMGTGISDLYFTSLRLDKGEDALALKTEKAREDVKVRSGVSGDSGQTLSYHRVSDSLAQSLSLKLDRFQKALDRFKWPSQTTPWFQSRMVVESPGMEGRAEGTAVPAGEAVPFNKYFSKGVDKNAATSVEAGTYKFRLTQGSDSADLAVTVASADSWGDVLNSVKDAVNNSDLSVRADVLRQNSPFQLDPSLATTGYVLALSVNPEREGQTVSLRDASGHLLKELGIREMPVQTSPAPVKSSLISAPQLAVAPTSTSSGFDPRAPTTLALGRHDFSIERGLDAQTTSYISRVFDPTQTTTLAAKDYTFTTTFGDNTKTMTVSVENGWTWNDVLNAVGAQINAQPAASSTGGLINASDFSQPGLEASLERADIASTTQAGVFTDGQILIVRTVDPAKGETLILTDGAEGLLSSLGLTAKLTGTPVSITVQKDMTWEDVMNQLTTAVGQTSDRLGATTIFERLRSDAVQNKTLYQEGMAAAIALLDQRLKEPLTLHDGATGMLSTMGMMAKIPGQDGQISVDFENKASENQAYSLEQGRLAFDVKKNFGETLPLSVVTSMSEIETRLGTVVQTYDDLQKFVYSNRDFFNKSLAATLDAPVSNNWAALSNMGFMKTSRDKLLWIDADRFWQKLTADGSGVEKTLWSQRQSLIPAWKDASQAIRQAGSRSFLAPETLLLDDRSPSMSEFDLERKNKLIDLLG